MSILKKIAEFINPPGPRKAPDYSTYITVKCMRCGEVIRNRIDLRNDLSIEYGDRSTGDSYHCRKVIIGERHCYQAIDVNLTFNSNHKLISKSIVGGEFIEEGETV